MSCLIRPIFRIQPVFSVLVSLVALLSNATQSSGDGTCEIGRSDCNDALQPPPRPIVPQALVAVVVADDGVRLQFVRVWPSGSKPLPPIRLRTPLSVAAVGPLAFGSVSDDSDAADGQGKSFGVVVVTMDGKTAWYRPTNSQLTALTGTDSMPHAARTTAVSWAHGTRFLALGSKSGDVSLWRSSAGVEIPNWSVVATMRPAHHDWESVRHVAVSIDGKFVVACSDDNVVLWHVAAPDVDAESAFFQEPHELQHLHGGEFQVSAVGLGSLPKGGVLITIAFVTGALEAWVALGLEVRVTWRARREDESRFVALATGVPAGTMETPSVVAGTADGEIYFWSLQEDGALRKPSGLPHWRRSFSQKKREVSSIDLLPSPLRVAVGIANEVVLLDAATGEPAQSTKQGFRGGSVVALAWQ